MLLILQHIGQMRGREAGAQSSEQFTPRDATDMWHNDSYIPKSTHPSSSSEPLCNDLDFALSVTCQPPACPACPACRACPVCLCSLLAWAALPALPGPLVRYSFLPACQPAIILRFQKLRISKTILQHILTMSS